MSVVHTCELMSIHDNVCVCVYTGEGKIVRVSVLYVCV